MKAKKTIKYWIIAIIEITIIVVATALIVNFGTKKEEIPWWNDYENLQFVLEDERSKEKSFTHDFFYDYGNRIYFNYTLYPGEYRPGREYEFIPKVKIFYKGVEKEIYTYVYKREKFPYYSEEMKPEDFDYNKPHLTSGINDFGGYRAWLYFYPSEEDYENAQNEFAYETIYIIVHRGVRK